MRGPGELNEIDASIALYPDDLVMQVCMAAAYPSEIIEAAYWVDTNPNLPDPPWGRSATPGNRELALPLDNYDVGMKKAPPDCTDLVSSG